LKVKPTYFPFSLLPVSFGIQQKCSLFSKYSGGKKHHNHKTNANGFLWPISNDL